MIKYIFTVGFLVMRSISAQSIDNAMIPRKSEFFIRLQQSLNTKSARTGDKFSSQVQVPVTVNDQIIVPVGSYIIGYVDRSKRAGLLRGKAELTLKFDTVILPDGTTRYMRAEVQSSEGYETDLNDEEGKIRSRGSQQTETASKAISGAITGAIVGMTAGAIRGGVGRGSGIGAAVGTATGGLFGLFKRGEDVILPRGSTLTIQLQDNLHFEKPKPRSKGTRLENQNQTG